MVSRRRFQFRLWHLLAMTLISAMLVSMFMNVVANLGYESADVEITGLTDEPDRNQLEYTVIYKRGATWSATPVPSGIPSSRFSELFGKRFQIKYRSRQVLWLEPDMPAAVANREVQAAIREFADQLDGAASER
jgi:hypothetical protein